MKVILNHTITVLTRILSVILAVIVTISAILFLPDAPQSVQQQNGYNYYRTLLGTAADDAASSAQTPVPFTEKLPAVQQATARNIIQAENVKMPKAAFISKTRPGYQGTGYVTNLPKNTESVLEFKMRIPFSQHYAVTVCAASSRNVTNAIRINGNLLTEFKLSDDSRFTLITFYGIFLEKGDAVIALDTIDGSIDVDFVRLREDYSLLENTFRIPDTPCNSNASPETVSLYQTLAGEWGSTTLTGQYVSDNSNRELNMIYQLTGQLPAIRFSALGTKNDRDVIEGAMDWSVYMHGIVGLMWFWNAPGSDSVYAKETDFNLYDAMRGIHPKDIAMMSPEEADKAVKEGNISPKLRMLIRDIDETSKLLLTLRNMNIPVLWRPLHEAGGGWYWWGGYGRDSYQMLWQLLYYRMTDYHNLNNLIWIWNGQSASYLVPEDTYDIASIDIYLQPEMKFGSRHDQFQALANLTNKKKILALSECSTLPDTAQMMIDHSVWSFFGTWYGTYMFKPDGTFSDQYYTSNDLYNLYNSERTLTLNDFLSLCQ